MRAVPPLPSDLTHAPHRFCPQDPLYRPNYYLSMQGFRDLTSKRVGKFVGAKFFSVFDYINDPLKFQVRRRGLRA